MSSAHLVLDRLPGRVYVCVTMLSASVLMLQIALNRLFSFTSWHHLAYISVSFALLGFGASGSVLAAFPRLGQRALPNVLALNANLSAVGCLVVLLVVGLVPVHLGDLADHPLEILKLAIYFGALSTPFFFAGLAIAVALRAAGEGVGRLYFWDLLGAGTGCALVVLALSTMETPRVVVLIALAFALSGLVVAGSLRARSSIATVSLVVISLLLLGAPSQWLAFTPSRDKLISGFLETGRHFYSHWGALYRTDLVGTQNEELSSGSYREIGISPNYRGPAPEYRLIFHDGTAGASMYRSTGDAGEFEMFRHHVMSTPYLLSQDPHVLVIGVGGGADIVNGFTNGAARMLGIELDPMAVELITEHQREFTGDFFDRPDLQIQVGEGRHFVRSTHERFDIVQLTGVDTLAALSSGAYIFAENYLYTVEAYEDYFGVLNDDGILSVAAVDYSPAQGQARHSLRFAGLAAEALRRRGVERPGDHIMILSDSRGIVQFEVITKLVPFTEQEVAKIESFLDREQLSAWYLPNRPRRQMPSFRHMIEASEEEREIYLAQTFLDLTPTTDDRPFFFSFYKWRELLNHRDEIDPGHLLATGQLVLVLILVMAIVFSVIAIGLPLRKAAGAASRLPAHWGFLGYFAALGAGFIFVEICFMQRFQQFLGHPLYSLSVVLCAFLIAAGIGANWSERLTGPPSRVLPRLTAVLTIVVVADLFLTPMVFDAFLASSLITRVAISALLCVPLGVVLGMFFPYGIRLTAGANADFPAWAWAVNGCLSVVGSVASIMLATTFGFRVVMLSSITIYWLGAASFIWAWARLTAATPSKLSA